MTKAEIQFLINKYGIEPSRTNGQNFLLDDAVVERMVQVSQIDATSTILEIGPGLGVLTQKLADTGATIVSVEADRRIAQAANTFAALYPNVTIHQADIRILNLIAAGLEDAQYSLIANLPYSITSWVLRQFLQHPPRAKQIIVMVQKEVAKRVLAEPGQMSRLSVACQCLATVKRIMDVPATSFYPQPKVDSSVIQLQLRPTPQTANVDQFMRLMRLGFAAKRKTLVNNLKAGLQLDAAALVAVLAACAIPAKARPQELSIEQWEQLRMAVGTL